MATDQGSIRVLGRSRIRYQAPECDYQGAGASCSRYYQELTLRATFPVERQWTVKVCEVHIADVRREAIKTGHLA